MTTFDRTICGLDRARIGQHVQDSQWLRDLLSLWTPAGTEAGDGLPVRLAVRDGYVNFYCRGRSIAKVYFAKKVLSAEIHGKYVSEPPHPPKNNMVKLRGRTLSRSAEPVIREEYGGLDMLQRWVNTAGVWRSHSSERSPTQLEKDELDKVVAQSPGVIDLEMGLPGQVSKKGTPAAFRMDLVALERSMGGYQIVLWEAKHIDNGLRRRGEGSASVVEQLLRYGEWLSKGESQTEMTSAYRKVCKILKIFSDLAKEQDLAHPRLGQAILDIAARDDVQLTVDPLPRLLIFDPNGDSEIGSRRYDHWQEHWQKLIRDLGPARLRVVTANGPFALSGISN